MDVYIYQAAFLCRDCGEALIKHLDASGIIDTGDTDDYPQGPYPDGGGESDSAEFCDSMEYCVNAWTPKGWPRKVGVFLENPLTTDGRKDIQERISKSPENPVSQMLADFYGMELIKGNDDGT